MARPSFGHVVAPSACREQTPPQALARKLPSGKTARITAGPPGKPNATSDKELKDEALVALLAQEAEVKKKKKPNNKKKGGGGDKVEVS